MSSVSLSLATQKIDQEAEQILAVRDVAGTMSVGDHICLIRVIFGVFVLRSD